jgi:hypothetical protein
MGQSDQDDTNMGPIINKKQFDTIRNLVEATIEAGARVVLDGPSHGLVMHPVILVESPTICPRREMKPLALSWLSLRPQIDEVAPRGIAAGSGYPEAIMHMVNR